MADYHEAKFESELCEHREGTTLRLDLATGDRVELEPLRGAGSGVVQDPVTQQQVAESPALRSGFTDALVEAQAAYGELVKQLFDADTKRADYFHSLITLLYLEAARTGDVG